ncbi:hypothetical protein PoB_005358100 [Plakobranchus ocellatus]|uniref:Uncharacterized protein n=1 Tax=Plakobranchus ocellatus TaxID=259542 RepID=A0AAV4C6W5_9GAST|nr:hypothetical protein PoB_005358100 [Plakobranchus ocellatus]
MDGVSSSGKKCSVVVALTDEHIYRMHQLSALSHKVTTYPCSTSSDTMKLLFALFAVCLIACAFAAPEKRFVLVDLQKEAAKILQCEATLNQAVCEDCCASTSWYHPGEQVACETACGILP